MLGLGRIQVYKKGRCHNAECYHIAREPTLGASTSHDLCGFCAAGAACNYRQREDATVQSDSSEPSHFFRHIEPK